jgi:seryl-tRNA synthetase
MQFSIKIYSDMNKSYLKSDSKKKVFNRFNIKELSTPQFAPFLNKNSMSNINLTDNNNIQKDPNLNPIKKFNSFLNINSFNKNLVQRNTSIDNNKISDEIEDDKDNKERNLSYERMLIQKGQEISQLKKILPQIKSQRNKLSLEIQNLEHEKTILKNKKDSLVEHYICTFWKY